jgi:hypothetical protein
VGGQAATLLTSPLMCPDVVYFCHRGVSRRRSTAVHGRGEVWWCHPRTTRPSIGTDRCKSVSTSNAFHTTNPGTHAPQISADSTLGHHIRTHIYPSPGAIYHPVDRIVFIPVRTVGSTVRVVGHGVVRKTCMMRIMRHEMADLKGQGQGQSPCVVIHSQQEDHFRTRQGVCCDR